MSGFFGDPDVLFSSFQTNAPASSTPAPAAPANPSIPSTPTTPSGVKRARNDDDGVLLSETKRPRVAESPVSPSIPQSRLLPVLSDASSLPIDDALARDRKACQHEVCVPSGWDASDLEKFNADVPPRDSNEPPLRVYPFELDPFQKVAVECLEKRHSVLVSAHTSAGKTVVAEYAIALALHEKQRIIYTSPIKALSNQKYRELYEEFTDVGLMTGDITINPNASCLVMTTEILRSMLYRGSEILREIGWVVFDEIHYMRDKERGVVWEETLILLPDETRFVFLSATIPNAREFAQWIAWLHKQPCHVVYTEYRPTPLQHYIFPAGGHGLHLVVDEAGQFREDNFQKALTALVPKESKAPGRTPGRGRGKEKTQAGGSDVYRIVKMIMERKYEPVIVFSFSKKECEAYALQMSRLDFNNEQEKNLVAKVYRNALDTLSEDDRGLPQIANLLPLLQRGIGIHHSGLLPLLKEVIEILFQEGLIKCLFATETFSIGLNMPAKTVVFTSVRKWDGQDFRWISGGEYIQMSGRAGRRGKDERGIVILMVDEKMEPTVAQGMLQGKSDSLISSFHIGYNMLLNLTRVDGIDPEHMLRHSFRQFQHDRALPALHEKQLELEKEREALMGILGEKESLVREYHALRSQISALSEDIRKIINAPLHAIPFIQPGRLVRVRNGDTNWGWGVVVNFQKRRNGDKKDKKDGSGGQNDYVIDVLLRLADRADGEDPAPWRTGPVNMEVVPVLLSILDGISSVRVYLPKDLLSKEARQGVNQSLVEVERRFPDGIPLLDPIEDMKVEDATFSKLVRQVETLENRLLRTPSFRDEELPALVDKYQARLKVEAELKAAKKALASGGEVILKDELKAMQRVLRRLGFVSREKGRVACEINSSEELVLTELLFGGFFQELKIEQIASVMSCFVFDEKSNSNPKIRDDLVMPLRTLQDVARRVAQVSKESKIDVDVEEYVKKFRPELMDVVFAWMNGAPFVEIAKMTEVFEGSIIRAMRRLEELLRQLHSAAKSIGNSELEAKLADCVAKLKRDIVFAASLYL